jgi:hypothetical protein
MKDNSEELPFTVFVQLTAGGSSHNNNDTSN